ncbi:MAG TPA: Rnase Y domain-containing protein, partial [Candidatus Paceibacterota bacterium]|nr:Rnase Y domain-containing protein [Candidatus Paceibacterota bacterium]
MSLKIVILLASAAGLVGIVLGYYLRLIISLGKRGSMELEIKQRMFAAEEESKKITTSAEVKAGDILTEARKEIKEKEDKIQAIEERLTKREDTLDKRQADFDSEGERLKNRDAEIVAIKEKADRLLASREIALEKAAHMNALEAKEELIKTAEKKYAEDIAMRIQKLETSGSEKLEARAKDILATAIQRLSTSVASDVFSTSIPIASDDIKGKIIGKEGRNIKAFERMTGVEVIVDDTPGAITLSSFDPIRRAVAKVALEK